MIDIQDIQSLTDFQRDTRAHISRLKKTGRPGILTINGRAELVVQSADSYRELMVKAEQAEFIKRAHQVTEDYKAGRYRTVDEVFDDLEKKYTKAKSRKKRTKTK